MAKDLTIREIKEKQKQLKEDLLEKLRGFEEETGIYATGTIHHGYTEEKFQNWLKLEFSSPFN